MTTIASSKTRTTDSTDRTATLPASRTAPSHAKTLTTRFGGTARRLLNTLMRSLASPHV